ncbi:unnamed protein product [Lactuca virosa]|uniref:Uncharacterized protein n=1 Tax=Lactuca virosa TaxID=75947 RepID=A0AAU9N785_9ASTR|nr:unnamed protein product [Lactuca virosa]
MKGVPPDLEPDVIMKRKGKNANSRNKSKSDSGEGSKMPIDPLKAKSVSLLINKFESEVKSPVYKGLSDLSNSDYSRSGLNLSDSSSVWEMMRFSLRSRARVR